MAVSVEEQPSLAHKMQDLQYEEVVQHVEQVITDDRKFPSPGDGAKYLVSSFCSTVDDLWDLLKPCKNKCCSHSRASLFHCPLCDPRRYKPTKRAKVRQHLISSHFNKRIGGDTASNPNGLYSVPCFLDTCDRKGRHFHCTVCYKTLMRKKDADWHIERCRNPLIAPNHPGKGDEHDHDYSVYIPKNEPESDDDHSNVSDNDEDVHQALEIGMQDVELVGFGEAQPVGTISSASTANDIEILMEAAQQTDDPTKCSSQGQRKIQVSFSNADNEPKQEMQLLIGSDGNTYAVTPSTDSLTRSSSGNLATSSKTSRATPSQRKRSSPSKTRQVTEERISVPDMPLELISLMESSNLTSPARPVPSPVPPPAKKPRRKFHSEEERKSARREKAKKYYKKNMRIEIGSSIDAWERQRKRDGFTSQHEFIKHLLAIHDKYCSFKHQPLVGMAQGRTGSTHQDIRDPATSSHSTSPGQVNTSVYIVIKNEPGTPAGGDSGNSSTFRVM